jgi:hypothetical protein
MSEREELAEVLLEHEHTNTINSKEGVVICTCGGRTRPPCAGRRGVGCAERIRRRHETKVGTV